MQFYLNGYKPGDPFIEDPHPSVAQRPGGLPEETDVLIIGCGPAGLVLAAQMANFPDIRTVVIDRKDGPLEVGQADGIACRTVEMFEAFDLAGPLLDEAYWVNEVAFWRPDPDDPRKIRRTGSTRTSKRACPRCRTSSSTRRGCSPTSWRRWSGRPASWSRSTACMPATPRSTPA